MDAATATALVVTCAETSLPTRAEGLLAMAEKLGAAAVVCGIPKKELDDAVVKFSEADEAGRLDAVPGLRAAATALGDAAATLARACDGFTRLVAAIGAVRAGAEEKAARPSAAVKLPEADEAGRLNAVLGLRAAATALADAAATLAQACDGFTHLVAAIGAVRASAEEAAARPKGCCARIKAWWREWRRTRSGGVTDPEALVPLLARDMSASLSHKGATVADLPAAGQESDRRSARTSACSAMQGTALVASLTLLPYMGPDGVLKADAYTPYRECVGKAFSWIWFLVGVGVPCLYVRSRILHFYTRLASRIGMLAATLLVIFYCHWSLFPDSIGALWALVIASVVLHFIIFLWACIDRDM